MLIFELDEEFLSIQLFQMNYIIHNKIILFFINLSKIKVSRFLSTLLCNFYYGFAIIFLHNLELYQNFILIVHQLH